MRDSKSEIPVQVFPCRPHGDPNYFYRTTIPSTCGHPDKAQYPIVKNQDVHYDSVTGDVYIIDDPESAKNSTDSRSEGYRDENNLPWRLFTANFIRIPAFNFPVPSKATRADMGHVPTGAIEANPQIDQSSQQINELCLDETDWT